MTVDLARRVFFYPHPYLRDRQLDTIRAWPPELVVNRDFAQRRGDQVDRKSAVAKSIGRSWKQILPLMNIKRRPEAPRDAVVYVWGGVMASGDFITDLDNPWALVGYNIPAMRLWRPVLRAILASPRCLEIRCMSAACAQGLERLFGPTVAAKARVCYPRLSLQPPAVELAAEGPRFLMIGTQFTIKGGIPLLRAWRRVRTALPNARLDVVTHLPPAYAHLAEQPGLTVHAATFGREEIWAKFLRCCDVLVHPTYVESFGMAVLEALGHGLAIVSTDVYALPEMVEEGVNGRLLGAPLSVWDGIEPSADYRRWDLMPAKAEALDSGAFESQLAEAMIAVAADPARLRSARQASLDLYRRRFQS